MLWLLFQKIFGSFRIVLFSISFFFYYFSLSFSLHFAHFYSGMGRSSVCVTPYLILWQKKWTYVGALVICSRSYKSVVYNSFILYAANCNEFHHLKKTKWNERIGDNNNIDFNRHDFFKAYSFYGFNVLSIWNWSDNKRAKKTEENVLSWQIHLFMRWFAFNVHHTFERNSHIVLNKFISDDVCREYKLNDKKRRRNK